MKRFATILLLSWAIVSGYSHTVKAEKNTEAPEELTEAIAAINQAANSQDLAAVMEYYDESFTNTDGLTTDSLAQALEQIWQRYPRLNYTTKIDSWSQEGDRLIAETTTTIKGVRREKGRAIRLNSTLESRQYFEDNKIIRQDILAEQSIITSGINPPQVKISAPKQVTTGERYSFDLIVNEPLGDRVLLGAANEAKTSSNLYLNPASLELEPLPAGGIYKTVTASLLPESNWLSGILVRGDGITTIAHRVNVKEKATELQKK